eukprot:2202687-Pyramimonas_sp.AAC.1
MAGMGDDVRERTDALDAAGNTTAAIGKGFAIGSACLVSLALFGSFVTAASLTQSDTTLLNNRVRVVFKTRLDKLSLFAREVSRALILRSGLVIEGNGVCDDTYAYYA